MCAVAGRRSLSLLLGFVLVFLSFTSHVAFPVVRYGKHPDSVAAECGLPCGEKKTQWTKIFNSIKLNSVAWFMEEWRENITAWCDWCSTRSASWSYYKHDLGDIWAKSFFFYPGQGSTGGANTLILARTEGTSRRTTLKRPGVLCSYTTRSIPVRSQENLT